MATKNRKRKRRRMSDLFDKLDDSDFEETLDSEDRLRTLGAFEKLKFLKSYLQRIKEVRAEIEVEKMHLLSEISRLTDQSSKSTMAEKSRLLEKAVKKEPAAMTVNDSLLNLEVPVLSQMFSGKYFAPVEEEEEENDSESDDAGNSIMGDTDDSKDDTEDDEIDLELGSDISEETSDDDYYVD